MKHGKQIVTLLTILAMLLLPVNTCAADSPGKEEVVYALLNADGSVREIDVVNIFDLEQPGKIVDHGDYASVRNMTTTDEMQYENGTVTIDAGAGKLYYEGEQADLDLPWDIAIRYELDGTACSAAQLAGASGQLRIGIEITPNPDGDRGFFDAYALQMSMTLDMNRCADLVAEGATVANVGGDKQLTYTILPGKGASVEITATVTEFEMEGIAINAIPLNLEIEIDDEALMEQVTQLLDAIGQLDDGAAELNSGVEALQNGARTQLQSGVESLQSGAGAVHSGAAGLQSGGTTLRTGAADLQAGAVKLSGGLKTLNAGVLQIQSALDALQRRSPELLEGSKQFQAALVRLQSALGGVSVTTEELTALTAASSEIRAGIDELAAGAAALEQSVSFESYQALMLANGLDVAGLKVSNTVAASTIQGMIVTLQEQAEVMESAGLDATQIRTQIAQLQVMVTLLGANNANIDGMQTYLNTLQGEIAKLTEGTQTLQTGFAAFDEGLGQMAQKLTALGYQVSALSAAVNTLVSEYSKLDTGIVAYTDAVAQIAAG